MLDEAKLLEMFAQVRERDRATPTGVEILPEGGLTLRRAWELARDPSLETEADRRLIDNQALCARVIEHFRRILSEAPFPAPAEEGEPYEGLLRLIKAVRDSRTQELDDRLTREGAFA